MKLPKNQNRVDNRVCYGITCTWFGSIYQTNSDGPIPRCPICLSPLLETPSTEWARGVARAEKEHPGYKDFIVWLDDKHFDTYKDAMAAYPGTIEGLEG